MNIALLLASGRDAGASSDVRCCNHNHSRVVGDSAGCSSAFEEGTGVDTAFSVNHGVLMEQRLIL
jgi:hypothetical protein